MTAEGAFWPERLGGVLRGALSASAESAAQYFCIGLAAYLLGRYFSRKDKFQSLIDSFHLNATHEHELAEDIRRKKALLRYLRYFNAVAAACLAFALWWRWPAAKAELSPKSPSFALPPWRLLPSLALLLAADLIALGLLRRRITRLEVSLQEAKSSKLSFVDEFFETVGATVKEIVLEAVAGKHEKALQALWAKVELAAEKKARLEAEIEESNKHYQVFSSIADQILNFDWCPRCLQAAPGRKPALMAALAQKPANLQSKPEGTQAESVSAAGSDFNAEEEGTCQCSPRCLPRFLLLCEALATKFKEELNAPLK